MSTNFSQTAAYIWSLADLLRGDFKQSQYGRVILPFTILRRLECVLEERKPQVLKQVVKLTEMKNLEAEAREKFLLKAAQQSFYNTSAMNLATLGSSDIKSNLLSYIDSFSKDAREIFEHFKFAEFVGQLQDANLLYKVVQKVALTDLSPTAISNHDMGLVFEELIRRFAESSNETAGEHFTPRGNRAVDHLASLHGRRRRPDRTRHHSHHLRPNCGNWWGFYPAAWNTFTS